MTKLEQLIQKHCPNGVPFKALGELGAFYGGLSGKSKNDFRDGNAKFITYMNVFKNISLDHSVFETVRIGEGERQNAIQYGDVLFTGSSETLDECGMASVLTQHASERLYLNSFCFGYRFYNTKLLLPDFAKYLFRSHAVRKQIKKTASGVTRFNVSKKKMKQVVIPLLPLPVQSEIVCVLDRFTERTAQLTAGLTAERIARRKQYEHIRNELLDNGKDAIRMKLGDVFHFQNGFAFKSALFRNTGNAILRITNIQDNHIDTNGLVYFDSADYKENLSSFLVQKGDIVVAMSGATTGKIGINDSDQRYYLNQRVGKFVPKEGVILNRYLYHVLLQKSEEIYTISGGGAQPNLSSEKLKGLTALIPPLHEQEHIAGILDRLDALCNELTSGLFVETEARSKQATYYWDKLLTFKELGV